MMFKIIRPKKTRQIAMVTGKGKVFPSTGLGGP
jgi:hypothetical protein